MAIIQFRSKRKSTGGRYTYTFLRRKRFIGRLPSLTKLADKDKKKEIRTKGGGRKLRLLDVKYANIIDVNNGKAQKVIIKGVLSNEANKHYVRRNIITKGTIIETDLGKAKVTNRPGQEGFINAVLIKE